jgi:secondary thiamine-phosphate synthase enzyme
VVETRGPGFADITARVRGWLAECRAGDGSLTIFLRHTSASLTIQENADPDVLADLTTALDRMAPQSAGYRHDIEGPDDMPAHIKAMLTATSLTIPVLDGKPALGTWQAVYVIEHRARAHRREAALHFIGTLLKAR